MLRFCSVLVLCSVATLPLCAQDNAPSSVTIVPNSQGAPIQHAPDGASRLMIQNIDIPAIPNAPFSAIVVAESTTIMPDGSKRSIWNHRLVARDSSGRVFQERRFLTPTGNVEETPISELDFQDPNLKELTICNPQTKICEVHPLRPQFTPPPATASRPAKLTFPNGTTVENQDLGMQMIEELQCLGSREITTIPGAVLGSDKPQPVVKEFWYSSQLGFNVVTKRFDPRVSVMQNFTVTEINRAEPDPKNFAVPSQYHVVQAAR